MSVALAVRSAAIRRWMTLRARRHCNSSPPSTRYGRSVVPITRLLRQVLCCSLIATALASAQAISTTQVQGTVQDSTGAFLPGVAVTMTQTATGLVRTTTSGQDGRYLFPALPIGPYRLEATLDGFRPYRQTGIVLQVNVNPTILIAMEIGGLTD